MVKNKRVCTVENYMSKVSKEDLEFLHLLMHLKMKDTGEEAWVNIIQCMAGKCEPSMQKTGSSDAAPHNTDQHQCHDMNTGFCTTE